MPAVHLSNLLPAVFALSSGQSRNGFLPTDLALGGLVVRHLCCGCSGLLPVGVLMPVLWLNVLGLGGMVVSLWFHHDARR